MRLRLLRPFCSLLLAAIPLGSPLFGHDPGIAQPLDLVGTIAPFGSEGNRYTDVAGIEDYAYIGTLDAGVAVVDLRVPTAPRHLTTYHAAGNVAYNDLKIDSGFGYFASSGGVHIVDLANPRIPSRVSRILPADEGFADVENVYVSGDVLFEVSTTDSRVKVFDVSSKASPQFVRHINTGDLFGLSDVTVQDDRLYVAGLGGQFGDGATYVYDVRDVLSSAPRLLGSVVTGTNTFTAVPTDDAKYLVTTQRDVGGALSIWNIENLGFASQIGAATATTYGLSAFSAGEVIIDDLTVFASWHQAGLQVLDLDAIDPNGVAARSGEFVTSPNASPLDGLTATRSAFIGLGTNRVLLSDTESGLYVVDATQAFGGLVGDFDLDGALSIADLDLLTVEISTGNSGSQFDLDGNSNVDRDDVTEWLSIAGNASIDRPFRYGDANLDGRVDPNDLNAVGLHWETDGNAWSHGDFTADGVVSAGDLNLIGLNWLSGTVAAAAVPEPTRLVGPMMAFFFFVVGRSVSGLKRL